MSPRITDAVLIIEVPNRALSTRLLAPLEGTGGQAFRELPIIAAGGRENFTSSIYAAAFVEVDPEELDEWFQDLPFEHSNATLFASDEFGAALTSVVIEGVWVSTTFQDRIGARVEVFEPHA